MTTRPFKALLLIVVLAGGALAAARPAQATVRVDIGFFFDALAPYGHWYENPRYGWVWSPDAVAVSWRPYYDGHWAYANEYGWIWASNEPWGWATDHYGRWYYDDYQGWIWVPGYEWAPAWVDWVSYDNYVGWAPLPPAATWSLNVGFAPRYNIGYDCYTFVEPRYLGSTSWRSYAAPRDRALRWAREGRRITRYQSSGGRIVNRSVSYVPRTAVQVVDVASPRALRRTIGRDQLTVFRPQVARNSKVRPQRIAPARAERNRLAVTPNRRPVVEQRFERRQPTTRREPRAFRAPQRTAVTRRVERQRPERSVVTQRVERQRQPALAARGSQSHLRQAAPPARRPAVRQRDSRERRQVVRQRSPQRERRQMAPAQRRSAQQLERGHPRRQSPPAHDGGQRGRPHKKNGG